MRDLAPAGARGEPGLRALRVVEVLRIGKVAVQSGELDAHLPGLLAVEACVDLHDAEVVGVDLAAEDRAVLPQVAHAGLAPSDVGEDRSLNEVLADIDLKGLGVLGYLVGLRLGKRYRRRKRGSGEEYKYGDEHIFGTKKAGPKGQLQLHVSILKTGCQGPVSQESTFEPL